MYDFTEPRTQFPKKTRLKKSLEKNIFEKKKTKVK